MHKPISVLLTDDHKVVSESIAGMLQDSQHVIVIGTAQSGEEVYESYFHLHPDVLVMDIEMPGLSGIGAAERILSVQPNAKILFLSMHDTEDYIYKVYKTGGRGLISKEYGIGFLTKSIIDVNSGKLCFGRQWDRANLDQLVQKYDFDQKQKQNALNEKITPREREVLIGIAQGKKNKEIAQALQLSDRTIETYRGSIRRKLGGSNDYEFYQAVSECLSKAKK